MPAFPFENRIWDRAETLPPDDLRALQFQRLRDRIDREIQSVTSIRAKVNLVEPQTLERSMGKAKRVIDSCFAAKRNRPPPLQGIVLRHADGPCANPRHNDLPIIWFCLCDGSDGDRPGDEVWLAP